MEIDLKHVSEERTRHGRYVTYVRLNGKRIRLLHPPGSLEFMSEYQEALASLRGDAPILEPKPAPNKIKTYPKNSFGWLVKRYFNESVAFKMMRPAGQRRRIKTLEKIVEDHGDRSMLIPTEVIAAGYAARLDKPGAAGEWLKALKALYSWSLKTKITKENPAAGMEIIEPPTEGFYPWRLSDVATFVSHHEIGSMAYLALIVLLLTGLRRSDAINFGRQHLSDGAIRIRIEKATNSAKQLVELVTDISWPLAQAIAAMPKAAELTFLRNGNGQKFASPAAFGQWFKDRCKEAGLPQCSSHGLRKLGSGIVKNKTESDKMMDAMYGWSDATQSWRYTKHVCNRHIASTGFNLIIDTLVEVGILTPPAGNESSSKLSHLYGL